MILSSACLLNRTSDIQKYDVNNETKLSTHYHDVFDTYESTKEIPHWSEILKELPKRLGTTRSNEDGSECGSEEDSVKVDEECTAGEQDSIETRAVERFFTFPAIDYIAGVFMASEGVSYALVLNFTDQPFLLLFSIETGTYSSKIYVVTLWVCGVSTYFAYLFGHNINYGHMDCIMEFDENGNASNRGQYFGCRMANGLLNWIIIMLELR